MAKKIDEAAVVLAAGKGYSAEADAVKAADGKRRLVHRVTHGKVTLFVVANGVWKARAAAIEALGIDIQSLGDEAKRANLLGQLKALSDAEREALLAALRS
jgi:hypothetical protein